MNEWTNGFGQIYLVKVKGLLLIFFLIESVKVLMSQCQLSSQTVALSVLGLHCPVEIFQVDIR